MNYRRLGSAGLKVSELSLGAWVTYGGSVGDEGADACMTAAYDAGINFFDNAEGYARGNAETVMGTVIRRKGWRRSSLVISTKYYWGLGLGGPNDTGLSRKRLMEGIDGSLKRLQMDYVDLIFAHRPDVNTPIEETVRAMHDIVSSGRALYWGTSEWRAEQVMHAWGIAERYGLHKPQMEQPQYHMFHRDRVEVEMERLYGEIGLGLTTWSPLASGLLSGKYNSGIPEGSRLAAQNMEWLRPDVLQPDRIEKVKKLSPIAKDLGCTMSQLALAWILLNCNVSSVITGASRPEQVTENLGALEVVPKLTADVVERLEVVLANKPVLPRP